MKRTKEQRRAHRAAIKAKFKNFFKKIADFFKNIGKKILPELLDAALKFMQGFKKVMNSGTIDFIIDLTPTGADNALIEKIRAAAEKVIGGLTIADDCLKETTLEDKLKCLAAYIKTLPLKEQGDILNSLHTDFLAALDGEKESRTDYMLAALGSYYADKTTTA